MELADRTRFVHQWWDREPTGVILDKSNPPLGKRCPEGHVWGHATDDLFMIERIPGVGVVTCYSRSMIKELNERPIDPGTEPATPRVRRPYPLLKLAPGVDCQESFRIGFLDEGSDHGDPVAAEMDDCNEGGDNTKSSKNSSPAEEGRQDTKLEIPLHMKLEEFIPKQFLPNVLIVHDPRGLSYGENGDGHSDRPERPPFVYRRHYPVFHEEDDECLNKHREAHLYLDRDGLLGVGHHSNVYRATLTLPDGLSARTPTGQVTVAAKTAFHYGEARSLLKNEGEIYNAMPRHLSEEWCGLIMVPPLNWPVPAGPIVPKFYGYYTPTKANGDSEASLSPILLMEECGTRVELRANNLSDEQKTECYSLFLRLHSAGFLHQSTYVRNIVMQPGPLTRHPSLRSMMTPSFRLIDFGRTVAISAGNRLHRADEEMNVEKELSTGLMARR